LGLVPRAVILSGALGSGHDMVSDVVLQSLEGHGWQVRTLDCMAMLGSFGANVGDRVFRRITAMPGLYDALHFAHFRRGTALVRALDREATRRLVPAVRQALAAEPAGLVVATFATGASVAAKLHAEMPGTKTIVLCTDVDPYWLWVWEELDLFLVTSQAGVGSVRRYAPGARVQIVPRPVRPAFYQAPDQLSARDALGLAHDADVALLMGGGWGLGPVEDLARALGEAGIDVLAVAGNNSGLRARLERSASRCGEIHPFGFTDRVPELMSASDVVVTTPGATTCSEARVVGRHLVVVDAFPGHGRQNLQHELEMGHADGVGPSVHEVLRMVRFVVGEVRRPLPTVVRPAREWPDAFAQALDSLGLQWRDEAAKADSGADDGGDASGDASGDAGGEAVAGTSNGRSRRRRSVTSSGGKRP
jgi:UDP-N-acetylglucosamine:LPS N-acetylglucosamine transferase